MTERVTEDRDGYAGAVPSVGGFGGHVGAPMLVNPRDRRGG
jgi:hypothetical protein